MCDAIAHPFSNFIGSLIKTPLTLDKHEFSTKRRLNIMLGDNVFYVLVPD